MTLNNIPPELHSQIRIGIISVLLSEDKNFATLKDIIKTTDGNLSTHLKKLESGNYIKSDKMFINRKPQTVYSLTKNGYGKYVEYVRMLLKNLE